MAGVAPYFGSLDIGLLRQRLMATEFKREDGTEGLPASSSDESWSVPISETNASSQEEIKEDMKVGMPVSASQVELIFQGTAWKGDGKGITDQHLEWCSDSVAEGAADSPLPSKYRECPFRRLNEKDKRGRNVLLEDVNFKQVSCIAYIQYGGEFDCGGT
jgi:hypothetical protein